MDVNNIIRDALAFNSNASPATADAAEKREDIDISVLAAALAELLNANAPEGVRFSPAPEAAPRDIRIVPEGFSLPDGEASTLAFRFRLEADVPATGGELSAVCRAFAAFPKKGAAVEIPNAAQIALRGVFPAEKEGVKISDRTDYGVKKKRVECRVDVPVDAENSVFAAAGTTGSDASAAPASAPALSPGDAASAARTLLRTLLELPETAVIYSAKLPSASPENDLFLLRPDSFRKNDDRRLEMGFSLLIRSRNRSDSMAFAGKLLSVFPLTSPRTVGGATFLAGCVEGDCSFGVEGAGDSRHVLRCSLKLLL